MDNRYVPFFEGLREENPLTRVPEGWTVYNAPRPLYGQVRWQGEFVHGVFYAAVAPEGDPADEFGDSPLFHRRNRELDGWVVRWITRAEVMAYARARYAELGLEHELDERDYTLYCQSYVEHLRRSS